MTLNTTVLVCTHTSSNRIFEDALPCFLPIIPVLIFVGQQRADEVWLISGLSPRMKQEWNRLQRTGVSTGVRAVAPEEESE